MSSEPSTPTPVAEPGVERSQDDRNRKIALGVLVGVAVLFTLLNSQEVKVNWIITSWKTPLILIIVLSAAIGGLVGWLLTKRRFEARGK